MQNKMSKWVAALAAVCVVAATPSALVAAEVTAGVDVVSAYVWRGITFNDGLVAQPSLDTAADLGEAGSLGFNVWGNFDIDDFDGTLDGGEFSEVDLTITWALPIEGLDVSVGFIEYLFPAGGAGTREVFVSVGTSITEGVSATVTGYYDFDEVEDFYANAEIAYETALQDNLTLGLSAAVGYAGSDASAGGESGFHEYTVKASLDHDVSETVSVGAFVAYTDAIDDDALPDGPQDVTVFGGVSLGWTF